MKTYEFNKDNLSPVVQHVASYGITILSLTPSGDNYIMQVDADQLPEGEYEHLNQEYGLVEVV